MHVALVHMRSAPTGGTERQLSLLAHDLHARGHRVTVICRSRRGEAEPGVEYVFLRSPALGGAWRMLAFARAVERHVAQTEYDVVLGMGKTWTHDVVRLGGGSHATYLERAHAATRGPLARALATGALKQRLALAIERRALAPEAARRVITNSEGVARDVERRYGVARERLRIVYNGVDLERFHPERHAEAGRALRCELGLSTRDRVLLFLGSGFGRKGLGPLLGAFAALAPAAPRARLVVCGFDSRWARYRARAERLGIASRVRFLGGRTDAERVFALADLYVLPTLYDPFANTTLEALASGLPVITSRDNGAAELIEDGGEGTVLGDPRDEGALARAILDWSERAAGARAACRALAERHPAERAAQETLQVLEEVVREKSGDSWSPQAPRQRNVVDEP